MTDNKDNRQIAELFRALTPDPWRIETGYSADIQSANEELWELHAKEAIQTALLKWTAKEQPCLFGRIASRYSDAISMCVLLEEEMTNGDRWVRDYIQEARRQWTRAAFEGRSSSFVIVIISRNLANALPDNNVFAIAERICSLYLLRERVRPDEIYHDEVFLEAADRQRSAWKWLAGVNYFSANGDARWWHDHRIPGGMAISVNSVGHFVKSRIMASAEKSYSVTIGTPPDLDDIGIVDSLPKALVWAMRTIDGAALTPDGKATQLARRTSECPLSPVSLPKHLEQYDHRFYTGYYHTDFTLPSLYFISDVNRPEIQTVELDFSYLFDEDLSNPDHITMGTGRRIRSGLETEYSAKRPMADAQLIDVDSSPRLLDALTAESEQ